MNETPEQAFRTVVKMTLDKLRAAGHEVPDDLLLGEYQVVAAGGSAEVTFICPRCWGDLTIVYDDETISLAGSLFRLAVENVKNVCHRN